jgi:hypothetical protein
MLLARTRTTHDQRRRGSVWRVARSSRAISVGIKVVRASSSDALTSRRFTGSLTASKTRRDGPTTSRTVELPRALGGCGQRAQTWNGELAADGGTGGLAATGVYVHSAARQIALAAAQMGNLLDLQNSVLD